MHFCDNFTSMKHHSYQIQTKQAFFILCLVSIITLCSYYAISDYEPLKEK